MLNEENKPAPETKPKAQSQEPVDERIQVAFHDPLMLRQNFYRDNYRMLAYFCVLLLFAIMGVMGWIFYERTNKPEQQFYATTSNGKLLKLSPLNRPNLSNAALIDWVLEAATAAYNFNFGNYQEVIQNMKNYFTDKGYENYLSALTDKKVIEEVREKRLVVFAVATGTPVILNEGPLPDGIYAWKVQMPMLVTYQSAASQRKQHLILTVFIARRPTLENPKGVGIASFIVREK